MGRGEMAIVEWSRLSGENVEELVAILLCRKYPAATRIRPSTGDGGIDLLLPASQGGTEIYQVKKFASNLTTSQKSQIESSLARLEQYRSADGLNVVAWHLLLPLDPTKENLNWLAKATEELTYPCDWRGLSFVDGLAAEFPDVVDYYVGNGRERLETVVGQLTSALGLKPNENASTVSPSQLGDYLTSLAPALDTDPHFKYEVSIGPRKSSIASEPGLILAATQSTGANDDSEVTVRVFPRFAAALDFRPIPIEVVIRAEPDSELHHELASFAKYGTSVSAPVGTVEAKMDLPGGLGGISSKAGIHILSTDVQPSAPSHVLRMVVVNSSEEVLSTVRVNMNPSTFGLDGTGARSTGVEEGGVFRVELLWDSTEQVMNVNISEVDVEGKIPSEVAAATRFLSVLHHPNRLAIASPRGPIESSMSLPEGFRMPDSEFLNALSETATSLAAIQDHTTSQLTMPGAISPEEAAAWRSAARLLQGEQIRVVTTGVRTCLRPGSAVTEGKFAFAFYTERSVTVGNDEIELGQILVQCATAMVDPTSIRPHDDHTDCSIHPADDAPVLARLV